MDPVKWFHSKEPLQVVGVIKKPRSTWSTTEGGRVGRLMASGIGPTWINDVATPQRRMKRIGIIGARKSAFMYSR
jgi:hypothetical protein